MDTASEIDLLRAANERLTTVACRQADALAAIAGATHDAAICRVATAALICSDDGLSHLRGALEA